MDRKTATDLINATFTQSFDEARYKQFVHNLLNQMDGSKAFAYQGQYIPDAFKDHVRQYKRIGKYTDPGGMEVDVMIVYLCKESSLDRARTMQRNFMTHYLKNRGQKDAALVAYIGEDPSDWRFSLVRIDYRTVQTESGRVKVKEETTPARRYSFLVGKNEPNHTACQQLVPILEDTHNNPTLQQIETAFNIESVTDEFFEKYKDLFLRLKEELDILAEKEQGVRSEFERCQINTTSFAKKLLGQIVFLYFLQKKGWLGVQPGKDWGTGSKNYMHDLFQQKRYQNYFNDVLEPLFYDALAVERKDSYYPRLACKIPFLNGGLFEPTSGYDWQKIDILIQNNTFQTIFETFNLYNFTVREDEPLEREVAVDPEMLGKVFEKLLDVQDRRSIGAFYTPREIVHYMCQESLINYLDTALNDQNEKKVEETPQPGQLFKTITLRQAAPARTVTTCKREDIEFLIHQGESAADFDAAKESGTKSYTWQMPESIRQYAHKIDQAMADVKICDPAIGSGAFPVGMMGEIVKARQVLSVYLPSDPSRNAYHFKRHAVEESIYGVDINASAVDIARLRLWLSLVVDEDDFQAIKPLPNLDYKIVCGNSLQNVKLGYHKGDIKALTRQFINETDSNEKKKIKTEIDRIIRILTQNLDVFDFHVYFSGVFDENQGFDVVIANPPYVRSERIGDQKQALKRFTCYTGSADLYVYFYEQGLSILRPSGTLTFISSNKYFRSGYGEKLRQFLDRNTIQQLIDFGDAPVFDAIAYPSIIILQKTLPKENQVRSMTWKPGPPIQRFAEIYSTEGFYMPQEELKPDGWRIESPDEFRLLDKLRTVGRPLGDYISGKVYYGIKTGLNEAFIVDRATRDCLIATHTSSDELLKPILRGRDVKRWSINYADLYLIKIESSENKHHPWTGLEEKKAEGTFRGRYPAIFAHLMQYRDRLIKREDQGKYFWELRSCKYWDEFNEPKIIYPNICKRNEFALDDEGFLTNQKAFIIPNATQHLLGVLNSRVIYWLFKQLLAKLQGDFFEPSYIFLQNFPIPIQKNDKLLQIVEQIIDQRKRRPEASISHLDDLLNEEVYRLYELSNSEIALIESETEMSVSDD